MSVVPAPIHTAPFDAIAERYDQTFTFSKIGRAQRAAVWNQLEKTFYAGDRVLEIGCGTGVDACFLANRGVNVIACDSSPQMIAVTNRRVAEEGKADFVQPLMLAAEDITALQTGAPYDGAFSNFGALNCVKDLAQFSQDLGSLLKPGAASLLCWLGPCCFWEVAWYLPQGKLSKALRRFRRGGVTAKLEHGSTVRVQYPSLRSLARTFAPHFELRTIHGIGVAVPPSYVEPWARRFPRLLDSSVRADSLLGQCPGIRASADHVLLNFRRKAPVNP